MVCDDQRGLTRNQVCGWLSLEVFCHGISDLLVVDLHCFSVRL